MGIKKIIAIGLVTATIGAVLIRQKIQKTIKQIGSVGILPVGISDLQFKWNDFKPLVSFKVDLMLTNPLTEAISINGLIAKVQRIVIYDAQGKALGVSTPNIGKINIPANGNYTLPKVPFTLDAQRLAITLINYKSLSKDNFKFETIVSILGAEYKIK